MRPPTTGCFEPHPLLENAAVRILREAESFPDGEPVRASVSAMGFGGIDTHVTLEAAPESRGATLDGDPLALAATPQDAEVFLFGADDRGALRERVARVAQFAARISFAELADLAAQLEAALPERAAVRGACANW